MASVRAVFYDGDQPVAFFLGAWEQFVDNRDGEGLPWRQMNGTPWEAIESYRAAPTLAEVDAWVAANPTAGPPNPQV
jgi:hypothetical protein